MHLLDDSGSAPVSQEQSFHVPSLLAATVAALLGAVVWAFIAWGTGYEVGYVAWGIGLLVGLAVVKVGGKGVITASTAAALTLAAIFVGKMMGTHLLIEKELEQVRAEYFSSELYNELKRDASAYETLPADPSDAEVRGFMVDYDYGGFVDTEEISDEDVAYFREYSVPALARITSENPSFTQWQDKSFADYRKEFEAEFDLTAAVLDELNGIDIIFAVLAVTTAFGMIKRAGDEVEPEEPPHYDEPEMRRAA